MNNELFMNHSYKMLISKQLKLYDGQISFAAMQFIGIWVSSNWNSQWKIFLDHIYSVFMLCMISSFLCTCLAYILRWAKNTEIMVETLLYFIAVLSTYIKMINIKIYKCLASLLQLSIFLNLQHIL